MIVVRVTFYRMVESRRRAEREAEYADRNTKLYNNFEYSVVVNKAAVEYTPKMFAIFQEQYARVHEYQFEPITAGSEQPPAPQSRIGKTVATKFPKEPKPSKNSKWMKGIVKISRMKKRNKFKQKRAKEAAVEAAVDGSRLQYNLAAIFDINETIILSRASHSSCNHRKV
ncbi:hypothetical protein LINPERPRIM_LOCUS20855 [Linum perenne]